MVSHLSTFYPFDILSFPLFQTTLSTIYAALGNGGYVIFVHPNEHVVIAISSYFKPVVLNRIAFIHTYIETFVLAMK